MWHHYVYVLCIHGPCSYTFIYLHFTYDTQRNQKQMFKFTFEASKAPNFAQDTTRISKTKSFSGCCVWTYFWHRLRAGKKITKSEGQKINSHFLAGWCLKIDWWMARKSFLRLRFPDGRHRKIYKQNPEPNSQPSNHRPSTRMEKKKHLQQKPAW